MSADIETPAGLRDAEVEGRPRTGLDRFAIGVGAVVAAQAVWYGVLITRGWFYEADFSNLAAPTGHPISWSWLTRSQGGHLAIAGRLMLWVLNRAGPLDFGLTVGLRLAAQALATLLLARLLSLLVGRRTGVIAVVALYAFSSLAVQSTLWLTAALGLLTAQLCVLAALLWHVRYVVTRRVRWAVLTAVALVAAALCAEQAVVIAVVLPLLTAVFLVDGTPRRRIAAVLRCWPEWLLIAAPVAAFAGVLLGSGRYASDGSLGVSAPHALAAVWNEWSRSLLPALFGGPFAWTGAPGNYLVVAAPLAAVRIGAGVLFAVLVAVTVRRTGPRALAAWSMPLVVSAVGIVVVAVGRYRSLGLLIASQFEHAAYTAVPAAIALALAWWSTTPADIAQRVGAGASSMPKQAQTEGRRARVVPVAIAAVLVASLCSAATYTAHWAKAPARRYVETLSASLHQAGDRANLFDTFVPTAVIPGILPHRHVSDLSALLGRHPRFEDPGTTPRVVDERGHIVAATFVTATQVTPASSNTFCRNLVNGRTEVVEPLDVAQGTNEWFLRLDYFQQHASVVDVRLVDAGGRDVTPTGGRSALLSGTLGSTYLHFPDAAPVAVWIISRSPATNVCLTAVSLGYPFPAAAK